MPVENLALSPLSFALPRNCSELILMWNDPIVEETRRLRDEYAAKHGYNIHAIVADLKDWQEQGFPLTNQRTEMLQPKLLSSLNRHDQESE